MKHRGLILSAVVVSLVAGCSTTPLVLAPVGPAPPGTGATAGDGHLVVYTATETHRFGDGVSYYPHTGYHIYTPDGKLWKYVRNHSGSTDQSPAIVTLPRGKYSLLAEAENCGRVTVPVVIEPRRTTEVHLETWGRSKSPVADEASVVRLPNGYVVGWRAP